MYDCEKRLFLHGVSRSAHVAFVQLRVGFCNLNYDLYIRNCVEAENYECGHIREDSKHMVSMGCGVVSTWCGGRVV